MKTTMQHDVIRQGDVLLLPCQPPADAVLANDVNGIRIAGSRTGHAHVLRGPVARAGDRVWVLGGGVLMHEEHEWIATSYRWYEVREQREHVPESAPVGRWD